jgi:hypothetical protein
LPRGRATHGVWTRGGRELLYLSPDYELMSVQIRGGDTGELDAARRLFTLEGQPRTFVASPDGQRLLVSFTDASDQSNSVTVLANWESALRP